MLLSCTRCNSKKKEFFKTENAKVIYNNEKFEDIHQLGSDYNTLEQPMIINPEKDDIINEIKFQSDAIIYSENKRVSYTINEACALNRDELVQHRMKIIKDFKNLLEGYMNIFLKDKDITVFKPIIEDFIGKTERKNEYFSFRNFILKNIDIFFDRGYSKIINKIIGKENYGTI